ncbi:hypothetical protein MNEG_15807, partial [Monoraphidium neglectum]
MRSLRALVRWHSACQLGGPLVPEVPCAAAEVLSVSALPSGAWRTAAPALLQAWRISSGPSSGVGGGWQQAAAYSGHSDVKRAASDGGSGSGSTSAEPLGFVRGGFKVEDFPPERIRNFSIV